MRHDDVADLFGSEAFGFEGIEEEGEGAARVRLDEGRLLAFDSKEGRGQPWAKIHAIDDPETLFHLIPSTLNDIPPRPGSGSAAPWEA